MIEVTEADRRAAAANLPDVFWQRIVTGKVDNHELVQAFAAHRIEAVNAERDRIVAWLRDQDGHGEWYEAADALENQP